mmetsp:Transcript_119743/g.346096  ORF Transcript_119743/g.346096 Transcript_119743/m.346096 type:complete len:597 (-) Transcript_119743:322-2112(-)
MSSLRLFPWIVGSAAASSGFLTSHSQVKSFPWTASTRSFNQALHDAFPGGHSVTSFTESRPGLDVSTGAFVGWVENDLLGGADPFGAHGGRVPLPWPQGSEYDDDQVGVGHYVAYSRRQLCFIVAKSLTGATTDGYANGLQRFLEKRAGSCYPRTGDFGRGLVVLLEACYADPALVDGGQGPLLVVAKASGAPAVGQVWAEAHAPLTRAGLRVCQYDDGAAPLGGGLELVPSEGCQQPSAGAPGKDFMTGGLAGQATQDISAAFLGGYVFGNACGLGGGQDERLMTYMPEVAALTFFLSQHWQFPQLRQPAWILGARMLFSGLDGTGRFNDPPVPRADSPITSDVQNVELGGATYGVSSSRPFVAFQSENQGFFSWNSRFVETPLARRNKLPSQREVSPSSWYAFDKQVRAWYRSIALTSYHMAVRPAMKALVRSVGTGPWLAGLWWGDSQLGFLAVWLGQAIAASTWGDAVAPLPVDFYMYSAFTESPSSQCFVHSSERCRACIQSCNDHPLPGTAFWMPDEAFFSGRSCVPIGDDCGGHGVQHVAAAYSGKTARELWTDIEARLKAEGGSTARTVFDVLLDSQKAAAQPETLLP